MDNFYITNRDDEPLSIVFEPLGQDIELDPGSNMRVVFWGTNKFVDEIAFRDGYVEIYSRCSFRLYIDGEEVYEFDIGEIPIPPYFKLKPTDSSDE